MVGREDNRTNNRKRAPNPKKTIQLQVIYQPEGPVKIGLLKGAGLLNFRGGPGVAVS